MEKISSTGRVVVVVLLRIVLNGVGERRKGSEKSQHQENWGHVEKS